MTKMVDLAEYSSFAKAALELYNDIPVEKSNIIFEKAMEIIKQCKQRYEAVMRQKEIEHKELMNGQPAGDRVAKHDRELTKLLTMTMDLQSDRWFQTLFNDVFKNMKYNSEIQYITLSADELQTLYAALPLFYSAVRPPGNFNVKWNDMEMSMISQHIGNV